MNIPGVGPSVGGLASVTLRPMPLTQTPTNYDLPTWHTKAACRTYQSRVTVRMFFEDIWPDEENPNGPKPVTEALEAARAVCAACPVRAECYGDIMGHEKGQSSRYRMGFQADMTPLQRWSAEHRKVIRCPECQALLDPTAVRQGEIACPNWCAIDRTMPAIHDDGDRWTRRHTTLARKVVRYLVENEMVEGAELPRPRPLAETWKDRSNDMCRVFEALTLDGTLTFDGKTYRRGAVRGAWKNWDAMHLEMAACST